MASTGIVFPSSYWAIALPVVLILLDITTGFLNAWVKKKVNSSVMRKGLAKKAGEIVAIIAAQVIFYSLSLPSAFVYGISLYVASMELVSICENLKKLGVKLPKFFTDVLGDPTEEPKKEVKRSAKKPADKKDVL